MVSSSETNLVETGKEFCCERKFSKCHEDLDDSSNLLPAEDTERRVLSAPHGRALRAPPAGWPRQVALPSHGTSEGSGTIKLVAGSVL